MQRIDGWQFLEVQKADGTLSLRIAHCTKGQRTERTLPLDSLTATGISEAFSKHLFAGKGAPEVWFKELCRAGDTNEYRLRLELQVGKSRQHFTRPCSRAFHDQFVELLKPGWKNPDDLLPLVMDGDSHSGIRKLAKGLCSLYRRLRGN